MGAETARLFASEGAFVYCADKAEPGVAALAAEIRASGGLAQPLGMDVSNPDAVRAAFARVEAEHDGFDVLVTYAGYGWGSEVEYRRFQSWMDDVLAAQAAGQPPQPLEMLEYIPDSSLTDLSGVHLGGTLYCARAAAPLMKRRGGGAIVTCSAAAAQMGAPGAEVYSAMKAGIVAMTRSIAAELCPFNIRANLLSPGMIETPMLFKESREVLDYWLRIVPMRRFGKPSDVANAALFLVSNDSAYITGQTLSVNGGAVMH
jgi:NAD(P)-dependent dehydrogenase (short-subunit alcohol dehydrogenase family)